MENEPARSAIQELVERFNTYAEGMIAAKVDFPRNWPYTQETIQMLNDECAALVRRYIEAGELEIGVARDCIFVYNAPFDVLPLIPLACPEISAHGTYDVMRGLKRLGRVTYNGTPDQDESGIVMVGMKTNFVPEEKTMHISFTLEVE